MVFIYKKKKKKKKKEVIHKTKNKIKDHKNMGL
jgi:hypothetical protein